MQATNTSISIAEALHKHHLTIGSKESKLKNHDKSKDVLYNFDKPLDSDVVSTGHHLKAAEKKLGHEL